jgi:hypothetical protein
MACRARAGSIRTETVFRSAAKERDLDPYAWFSWNSDRKTHPAGEKAANDFGLHDLLRMFGNGARIAGTVVTKKSPKA